MWFESWIDLFTVQNIPGDFGTERNMIDPNAEPSTPNAIDL
jgi:hypothetical protein